MPPKQIKLDDLLEEGEATEKLTERIALLSFEQALALLEELVQGVESGGLSLDKSLLSYERGAILIEHLKGKLTGAEEKLRVLQPKKSS